MQVKETVTRALLDRISSVYSGEELCRRVIGVSVRCHRELSDKLTTFAEAFGEIV